MIQASQHTNDFWLRLDNAAKIYPAVRDRELTSVFRIGVTLKERVKAKQFLEAIHELEERFPYYKVKLKAGFFWYYLEPSNLPIAVKPDREVPCRAFEKNELMFRVLVKNCSISVEFSHILTDATGAFEFLKALLFLYLEKSCLISSSPGHVLRPQEKPQPEEYEDAYKRYFKKISTKPVTLPKAFHLPFPLAMTPRFQVLTAVLPIKAVIAKAKEYEVSLTEYLSAVYLFSLQAVYEQLPRYQKRRARKILRIEVPVNLRKMFASTTMRNFSLFVMPGIDVRLGQYSFEEIVKVVHHQMQLETDQKLISKMISRNVSGERNAFIRRVPLFIKALILPKIYAWATAQYSGVVTNLGKVDFGTEANELIDHFVFIPPPPSKIVKVNCALVGFDGKLLISFGNLTTSKELERQFLVFLTGQGIPVKIINNQ